MCIKTVSITYPEPKKKEEPKEEETIPTKE